MKSKRILKATTSITNIITCVGLRLKMLEYSSLNLIKPPNPDGTLTPVSAIDFTNIGDI